MTAAPTAQTLRYGQLDRDLVVDTVLAVARQVGFRGLTMRAVASRLGISPAALYYHVPTKEALLDLAAETVLASVKVPPVTLGWSERLRQLFSRSRAALLPVDGIAGVLQSRPLAGSGRVLDAASLEILNGAGFDHRAARAAHMLLATFLLGTVALEQALTASDPGNPRRASRAADFTAGLDTILTGLAAKGEFT